MTIVLTQEMVDYLKSYGQGKGSWGCSEEHRQSLSEANKGKVHSGEWNKSVSKAKLAKSKPVNWTPEMIEAFQHVGEGSGSPGKPKSEEHRRHMSEARFGSTQSEEARIINSESHMGQVRSKESCRATSIGMQQYWAELPPEEKERKLRETLHSPESQAKANQTLHERPTKDEKIVDNYLQEHFPGKYTYKGDSYIGIVPGRSRKPDFISVDGKEAVSVMGGLGRWHYLDDEAEEVEYYKGLGIKCTVVWDRDIWSPGGLDKIFKVS